MPPTASPTESPGVHTVAFVSLGCPKNLVDSEKMLGLLAEGGILPIDAEDDFAGADTVVINTCGFLEASKLESVDEINRAAAAKRRGDVKRVVVAGCLVQRHRAKLLDWCPDIDAMIGVFDRDKILDAVRGPSAPSHSTGGLSSIELPVYSSIAANATLARAARGLDPADDPFRGRGYFEDDSARLRLTPRHYAYLRISEGCNQNCAFCTIPSIRGKMRSKPLDHILKEAEELFNDGAFELNLIGQDTTSYGQDIGYDPGLVGMLTALNDLAQKSGGAWIRLMYAYPSCFTDEMIDAIAGLANVVKYIDMPLQHINDAVLDNMRRRTSRKLIETLLSKLRDRVANMAVRTTFISGFPGETNAQHRELVEFIADFQFEAMGVFPYSPEPGTPAGSMYDHGDAVPDDVIQERIDELMLAQQQVAFARNQRLADEGGELDLLIDAETDADEAPTSHIEHHTSNLYAARSPSQAPDIDAVTYVESREPLSPGELLRCRVTGWSDYDLIARPLADLSPTRSLPILR